MITWIASQTITIAINGWNDVDVSAYVPAGATGVIGVVHTSVGTYDVNVGFRKNGSTDNRAAQVLRGGQHMGILIGVDANRIFESYAGQNTIRFLLLGYTTDESVFFTNEVVKTFNTSAFTDVSIAADTGEDTAMAAIIHVYSDSTATSFGIRKNGSTDDRQSNVLRHCQFSFAIGVDGSEIFEAKRGGTNVTTYLQGYIKDTANAVFNTNGTNLSAVGDNTWRDYTLPAGATGGIFELVNGGTSTYCNIIKKGDTQRTDQNKYTYHIQLFSECDAEQKVSYYANFAANSAFLIGYSTPGTTFVPQFLNII